VSKKGVGRFIGEKVMPRVKDRGEQEGLRGKTPAEACGITVKGKNKWITLIQNASSI